MRARLIRCWLGYTTDSDSNNEASPFSGKVPNHITSYFFPVILLLSSNSSRVKRELAPRIAIRQQSERVINFERVILYPQYRLQNYATSVLTRRKHVRIDSARACRECSVWCRGGVLSCHEIVKVGVESGASNITSSKG